MFESLCPVLFGEHEAAMTSKGILQCLQNCKICESTIVIIIIIIIIIIITTNLFSINYCKMHHFLQMKQIKHPSPPWSPCHQGLDQTSWLQGSRRRQQLGQTVRVIGFRNEKVPVCSLIGKWTRIEDVFPIENGGYVLLLC